MRPLLRLIALCAIVVMLGGATCYRVADPEPVYVPGYGFVVVVDEYTGVGFVNDDVGISNPEHRVVYIFKDEKAARDFIATFGKQGLERENIPQTYDAVLPRMSVPGQGILQYLRDRRQANLTPTLERATPPLPTGPQPQ